ncbi:MAG: hypothetical protein FJZ63_03435, partial [Chlamydiae bacterium]|nr:hypothetical protein [Chlamydiota bacterium]
MTFPDYARLGALEALHLHSAAAMLQATLENPPQSPPSPPTFAIDTPMSLSWALQALDLSKKNITIFTYSSWGQERKLNLSYNPQLELISSWYQDSFLLEELFLAGIKNGKASLLA